MYPRPRRFLWYPALAVLLLFVFKDPEAAAHLAHWVGELLSEAADVLAKLVGSA